MRRRKNHAVRNITILTLVAMLFLASNVFLVTVAKVHSRSGTDLTIYASEANQVKETDTALRGNIYDKNGNVIAQDNRTYNIVCILDSSRPSIEGQIAYVKDREHTAEVLSEILKMDKEKILGFLSKADNGVYQTELGSEGRNLTKAVKEEIEATDLTGIEFTDSVTRVYPYGQFASNLIGYAQANEEGTETVGKMGLELYLNSYLKGTDGYKEYQVDKNGYHLPGMEGESVSAINGDNVYLTIDATIQEQLEQSLAQTNELFSNVTRAWASVMEIDTGKVIAWGQTPSYDPNKMDITEYNNIGAQLPYEAGSTMKTFTWAAAINEGLYNGEAPVDGYRYCFTSDANGNPVRTTEENAIGCIYNAHRTDYGTTTYDFGLMRSLNSVALSIQNELITPQLHLEYLKKFGFWEPVDTDGLAESSGTLNFNTPADKVSLAYGQGSSVTMLQLLQAYSAVFGDGTMKKPYFVDSIRDPYDNSKVSYQAEPQVVGTPITEETAKTLQSILYKTVNDEMGTAYYYRIPECELMGKTGTTEVANSTNSYDSGVTITSVMLAMPADDPKVMVYYAFQADYDKYASYYTEPVTNLLRKVAITYGFTNDSSSQTTDDTVVVDNITTSPMPSLLNHSLDYANQQLTSIQPNLIVLGNGSSVIDQYPREGSTVSTGQRVFLLTDTSSFTMPDLTGWTRSDISALWSVSGFEFSLSGSGKVISQSIPAGTIVTKGTTISVEFG